MADTLRLGIDPRLLKELPAMFASFEEALTELVQNAYRAGARRIEIEIDHDRRQLTVQDDGPGAPDPATMLTAGRSGWGEHVIEPAGLGLFALLGLSQEVVIESRLGSGRGWRVRLDRSAFDGEPVEFEELHPDEVGGATGVRIWAQLGESADLRIDLALTRQVTFRHFFPLDVVLTQVRSGERKTVDLPPPKLSDASLLTPVGRVAAAPGQRWYSRSPELWIVWEHRVLSACAAWPDVREALEEFPEGRWVEQALADATLYWLVDPATGVRPKLPDRREVVRDEAYRNAVRRLAAALVEALDIQGIRHQVLHLGLPDVIENPANHQAQLARVRMPEIFHLSPEALLGIAGYTRCRWTEYDRWWEEYDRDGFTGLVFQQRSVWVRDPLRVRSGAVAETLCRHGVWAVYDSEGLEVTVEAAGVRWAAGDGRGIPDFAFCRELRIVAGTGETLAEVELLAAVQEEADELDLRTDVPRPAEGAISLCLWKAEPAEALAALRAQNQRGRQVLGCVLDDAQQVGELIYDWMERDGDGDPVVITRLVLQDLVPHLAEQVLPDQVREERRYDTLRGIADEVSRVRHEAERLLREIEKARGEYPEVAELATLAEVIGAVAGLEPMDLDRYLPASLAAVG